MKLLFGVVALVFGIVSFGLVDSVYADHPASIDSELTFDIRINNCTSFTIFGNADEIVPIRHRATFYEYLDENRNYRYYSYNNYEFPNSDGSFEHTITVNSAYNYTVYQFNARDYDWIYPKGTWYLDHSYDHLLSTELYQGHIQISLSQETYKPHRSDWIDYYIDHSYRNHTHHDNATEHTHAEQPGYSSNPATDEYVINVRNNLDTNQLCLYKTELVCHDDHDNRKRLGWYRSRRVLRVDIGYSLHCFMQIYT